MKVEIVVITLNQHEYLTKLFETARRTECEVKFQLFLHSQHKETVQVCQQQNRLGGVVYYPYGINRGAARSWNDGILAGYEAGADVVLVVNDDVWFSNGDVVKIAEAAMAHRDCYGVVCSGHNVRRGYRMKSHGFACFAINPIALEKVGCFDENFFPICFEDADYVLRATALGLRAYNVETTEIYHAVVATRHSPEMKKQSEEAYHLSKKYFVRKWGRLWGEREGRIFKTPFNDPRFDCHISPEDRHAPYPGYNRQEVAPC